MQPPSIPYEVYPDTKGVWGLYQVKSTTSLIITYPQHVKITYIYIYHNVLLYLLYHSIKLNIPTGLATIQFLSSQKKWHLCPVRLRRHGTDLLGIDQAVLSWLVELIDKPWRTEKREVAWGSPPKNSYKSSLKLVPPNKLKLLYESSTSKKGCQPPSYELVYKPWNNPHEYYSYIYHLVI